ncbi:hypothetical protein FZ942_22220 [Azospirillum lipoferum]|uniref:Uncharacterized protein n=1 Tax=Azospirillum lipoferum TaxID=193 RepID=A0A5A9GI82_AZOLI|nr:hypothetical protein FZ942_22220 [Azospirillum lipoferum]
MDSFCALQQRIRSSSRSYTAAFLHQCDRPDARRRPTSLTMVIHRTVDKVVDKPVEPSVPPVPKPSWRKRDRFAPVIAGWAELSLRLRHRPIPKMVWQAAGCVPTLGGDFRPPRCSAAKPAQRRKGLDGPWRTTSSPAAAVSSARIWPTGCWPTGIG